MAKDKKGFVLYADMQEVFEELDDKDAGQLIRHIFAYVNDENPVTDNPMVKISFIPIKKQLKRDLEKYEKVREKRSIAGKKSAESRQQTSTKSTHVKSVEQTSTKSTVNVNDNVNVSVNDNVTVNVKDIKYKNILLSELKNSDVPNQNYYDITIAFYNLFKANLKELGINTTTISKAKGKWIDNIRLLIEIDKRTQEEIREVFDLLKTDKFWRKNILSTSKLREKFEKLLIESRTKKNGANKTNRKGASYEEIGAILEEEFGHLPN